MCVYDLFIILSANISWAPISYHFFMLSAKNTIVNLVHIISSIQEDSSQGKKESSYESVK